MQQIADTADWRCPLKQVFLKILQYCKTPVLDSFFNNATGIKACNFIKKRDFNRGVLL